MKKNLGYKVTLFSTKKKAGLPLQPLPFKPLKTQTYMMKKLRF